ncbi:type I-E CRISPR-associated protein Cas7/Cse4/CasC [Streptomyces sp. INA 01156]
MPATPVKEAHPCTPRHASSTCTSSTPSLPRTSTATRTTTPRPSPSGTRPGPRLAQAWKRPIRLNVEQDLGEHAARTRMVPPLVARKLQEAQWPEDLATFASAQIVHSAKKDGLQHNDQQGYRTKPCSTSPRTSSTTSSPCAKSTAPNSKKHSPPTPPRRRSSPFCPPKTSPRT